MARILTGKVVSDRGDKTIVISVASRKTHPIYRKRYTKNSKFMAHDEKNQAKVGDRVSIKECRPISARKRFMLEKIIDKAHGGFKEADAMADVPEEPKEKQVARIKKQATVVKAEKTTKDAPVKEAK